MGICVEHIVSFVLSQFWVLLISVLLDLWESEWAPALLQFQQQELLLVSWEELGIPSSVSVFCAGSCILIVVIACAKCCAVPEILRSKPSLKEPHYVQKDCRSFLLVTPCRAIWCFPKYNKRWPSYTQIITPHKGRSQDVPTINISHLSFSLLHSLSYTCSDNILGWTNGIAGGMWCWVLGRSLVAV